MEGIGNLMSDRTQKSINLHVNFHIEVGGGGVKLRQGIYFQRVTEGLVAGITPLPQKKIYNHINF